MLSLQISDPIYCGLSEFLGSILDLSSYLLQILPHNRFFYSESFDQQKHVLERSGKCRWKSGGVLETWCGEFSVQPKFE